MRKIKRYKKIFTQGYKTLKYFYYVLYCKLFNVKEYSNCYLVSERGTDARDNGYFFYKYLVENHKDIDVRYVISSDSPDFDKIKKIGKYIIYGSKEHYIAFITSPYLIGAHLMGFSPDMGLFCRLQRYGVLKNKGKLIMLQHGIVKDYLSFWKPDELNLSLLISGASRECKFLMEKNGFSKDVVKYTGLARYDNLKKIKSRQILFMPTFRKYMHFMSDKEFINSDYYKCVNGLINNSKLINLLEINDLSLVFYIHYEFQKYIHLFENNSSRIIIAKSDKYDVQELLINSCLLITDYSSVFFDFAYMEKPIIYYQFDYNEYRKLHYEEGYFSYEKDGFGPVVYKENDVIKYIKLNIKNDFNIDKKTKNKVDSFFSFHDNNNCERIYEEIIKLGSR